MVENSFSHWYTAMIEDAKTDDNILGIILAGSRARGLQNKQSDCDIYIIFKDVVTQDRIVQYDKTYIEKYGGQLRLDISNKALQTISEFAHYAELGTSYYYDRYNLVHSKIEFDKTNGKIANLLQKIETLTKDEQATIVHNNLGDYISLVYQSIKSNEADRKVAASLDTAESIQYLLASLFALHDRVRPYNKYLEWELIKYPLAQLPWQPQEFLAMLTKIVKETDMKTQQVVYIEIEKLAQVKAMAINMMNGVEK
jgi:predicted nucleotidyltransferase